MLAAIALTICCVCLIKMKRDRYVWIPAVPTVWLLICTLTAGWQKVFHADPRIGFLATANKYSDALGRGEVLAPAKSVEEMGRVVFNNYVNATLAGIFMTIVVIVVVFGILAALKARRNAEPTAQETPYVSIDSVRV
jgi:carbon starvation protein